MVGVLGDDTDPMVTVMKLEKAPQETYADIGGLDNQIQEIKVREREKKNENGIMLLKTNKQNNSHMFGFVLLSFLVHVLLIELWNWFYCIAT